MTQISDLPTQKEMEGLFVNNEKLDQLSSYLNRFNPIRTMRMERMEIRHSAILSWLLEPRETHGFGDQFLKALLAEALRGQSDTLRPTALEISQADLSYAEIRREKDNIDILVVSKAHGWAFLIENKFDSKQHSNQLTNYLARIKGNLKKANIEFVTRGIFLSLMDEEPEDQSYVSIRYSDVCRLLGQLIKLREGSISQDVLYFLNHYLEVIKDAAGMNEERDQMEALARKLYRDHKKALDFVREHGASTDFILAANQIFDPDDKGLKYNDVVMVGKSKFAFNWNNNSQFSFLPEGWRNALGGEKEAELWVGCENWWSGYPLICWLQLFEDDDGARGKVRLYAEVGPLENHSHRRYLIERIESMEFDKKKLVGFQKGAANEGKRYSKFLKTNDISVEDIHDAEQIEKAIRDLIKKFTPVFEAVVNVLPDFFAEVKGQND